MPFKRRLKSIYLRTRFKKVIIFIVIFLITSSVYADYLGQDLLNLEEANRGFATAYLKISIDDAWDKINTLVTNLSPLKVGILDTGIDAFHPEFAGENINGNLVGRVNLGSTILSSNKDFDKDGHGTQVAGIIGANNISFQVPYIPLHMNGILSGANNLDYSLEIRKRSRIPLYTMFHARNRLNDLIESNVQIINVSLTSFLPNVVDYFFEPVFQNNHNILFVIAAGNDGINANSKTPARLGYLSNVVIVGAVDLLDNRFDTVDGKSNFGDTISISAPGEQVYAPKPFVPPLDPTDYDPNFTDTSAATPMVTGVAGLLKAINPLLTPVQIKQILIESADVLTTDNPDELQKTLGPTSGPINCNPDNLPNARGCRLNAYKVVCHPLVGLNCEEEPLPPPGPQPGPNIGDTVSIPMLSGGISGIGIEDDDINLSGITFISEDEVLLAEGSGENRFATLNTLLL